MHFAIEEYIVQAGIASKQRFTAITLHNPQDYIARQVTLIEEKNDAIE